MPFRKLSLFLFLVGAFFILPQMAGVSAAQKPKGRPPAPVKTAVAIEKVVEEKVSLTGNVQPHRFLTLASRIEEIVAKGLVEEGETVKKDQILLTLEKDRLQLRLRQSKAVLREAKAALKQMQRDFDRKEKLFRTKSISTKDMEDASTQVERQRAMVDRARETTAILIQDLEDALVRAPKDGIVVRRLAYEGEWVKKGGPVLEMAALDPVKVVVPVPERYIPLLSLNSSVAIKVDALPNQDFTGKIMAIIPQGDEKSRTFPVQIRIPNSNKRLKPGMLARVNLPIGNPHKALLIPKDALVIASGGKYLVVTVQKGRASHLPVKLIRDHGGFLEVKGPLKPGMELVVLGNERLRPGQPVKVMGKPKKGEGKVKK